MTPGGSTGASKGGINRSATREDSPEPKKKYDYGDRYKGRYKGRYAGRYKKYSSKDPARFEQVCHFCGKIYKNKLSFEKHLKSHSEFAPELQATAGMDGRTLSCPFCSKEFRSKLPFEKHISKTCPQRQGGVKKAGSALARLPVKKVPPAGAGPSSTAGMSAAEMGMDQRPDYGMEAAAAPQAAGLEAPGMHLDPSVGAAHHAGANGPAGAAPRIAAASAPGAMHSPSHPADMSMYMRGRGPAGPVAGYHHAAAALPQHHHPAAPQMAGYYGHPPNGGAAGGYGAAMDAHSMSVHSASVQTGSPYDPYTMGNVESKGTSTTSGGGLAMLGQYTQTAGAEQAVAAAQTDDPGVHRMESYCPRCNRAFKNQLSFDKHREACGMPHDKTPKNNGTASANKKEEKKRTKKPGNDNTSTPVQSSSTRTSSRVRARVRYHEDTDDASDDHDEENEQVEHADEDKQERERSKASTVNLSTLWQQQAIDPALIDTSQPPLHSKVKPEGVDGSSDNMTFQEFRSLLLDRSVYVDVHPQHSIRGETSKRPQQPTPALFSMAEPDESSDGNGRWFGLPATLKGLGTSPLPSTGESEGTGAQSTQMPKKNMKKTKKERHRHPRAEYHATPQKVFVVALSELTRTDQSGTDLCVTTCLFDQNGATMTVASGMLIERSKNTTSATAQVLDFCICPQSCVPDRRVALIAVLLADSRDSLRLYAVPWEGTFLRNARPAFALAVDTKCLPTPNSAGFACVDWTASNADRPSLVSGAARSSLSPSSSAPTHTRDRRSVLAVGGPDGYVTVWHVVTNDGLSPQAQSKSQALSLEPLARFCVTNLRVMRVLFCPYDSQILLAVDSGPGVRLWNWAAPSLPAASGVQLALKLGVVAVAWPHFANGPLVATEGGDGVQSLTATRSSAAPLPSLRLALAFKSDATVLSLSVCAEDPSLVAAVTAQGSVYGLRQWYFGTEKGRAVQSSAFAVTDRGGRSGMFPGFEQALVDHCARETGLRPTPPLFAAVATIIREHDRPLLIGGDWPDHVAPAGRSVFCAAQASGPLLLVPMDHSVIAGTQQRKRHRDINRYP
eukprot:Clim_evm49s151 gene=Clim_evmTU49s151